CTMCLLCIVPGGLDCLFSPFVVLLFFFFFFFQAEDGIRDRNVTGVQTCALPISPWARTAARISRTTADTSTWGFDRAKISSGARSEERRVGKECRSRWSADYERKKKMNIMHIRAGTSEHTDEKHEAQCKGTLIQM